MGVGGPGYTGPGDIASGATAWYGLRAYSRAVAATGTQKAVNIRTARDNSTTDILILPSGGLDVAAAAAFAQIDATGTGSISGTTLTFTGGHVGDVVTGGTTAAGTVIVSGASPTWTVNISQTVASATLTLTWGSFVTKWYDQSGNGKDAVQATAATQPQLLLSSLGLLPTLLFSGAQNLQVTIASLSQPFTIIALAKRTNTTTSGIFSTFSSGTNASLAYRTGANSVELYAGTIVTVSASDGAFHALQAVFNGASSVANIDGSASTVNPGTGATSTTLRIGDDPAGAAPLTGNVAEGGIWPSAFASGIQAAMNSNIHTYGRF